jgi:hypothetical protein
VFSPGHVLAFGPFERAIGGGLGLRGVGCVAGFES